MVLPTRTSQCFNGTSILANCLVNDVPLDELIQRLIVSADITHALEISVEAREYLFSSAKEVLGRAFQQNETMALQTVHRALSHLYQPHVIHPNHPAVHNQFNPALTELRLLLEYAWEKWEISRISPDQRSAIPLDPKAFQEWFISYGEVHRVNTQPFFEFLAEEATIDQIRYFFLQEAAVDTRFDDIIALTQIGLDGPAKLELAGNFWDEMGNGTATAVHTTMFNESLANLGWTAGIPYETLSWTTLANSNLLLLFSVNRRHCFKSVGCLGILEWTAPYRFQRMVDGCLRLGIPEEAIAYQKAHVGIDTGHGQGFLKDAIGPPLSANMSETATPW